MISGALETGHRFNGGNMRLFKKIRWSKGMTVFVFGIAVCLLSLNQLSEQAARKRVERKVADLQLRLDAIELRTRAIRMEMDFVRLDNYFRIGKEGWRKK
jgi:hypothetical protein